MLEEKGDLKVQRINARQQFHGFLLRRVRRSELFLELLCTKVSREPLFFCKVGVGSAGQVYDP